MNGIEPEADYMRRDYGPTETGGETVFINYDPDDLERAPLVTVGQPGSLPLTARQAAAKLAASIAAQNAQTAAVAAPAFPWFAVGIGAAIVGFAIYRSRNK